MTLTQELGVARILLDWLTDEDIGLLVEAALQGVEAEPGKPGWTETVLAMDEHLRLAATGKPVDRPQFRRDTARMAEIAEQAVAGSGITRLLAHDWPDSLTQPWARNAARRMGAEALPRLNRAMLAARKPRGPGAPDRRRPIKAPGNAEAQRIAEQRFALLSTAMTDFARWAHRNGAGYKALPPSLDRRQRFGISSLAATLLAADTRVRKTAFKDTVALFRELGKQVLPHVPEAAAPLPQSVTRPEMKVIYQLLKLDQFAARVRPPTPADKVSPPLP